MNSRLKFSLCLVFIISTGLCFAQKYYQRNIFGIKLSTTGVSVEAGRSFGKEFNFRAGASVFRVPLEYSIDKFLIEGDINLFSASFLTDWFPMKNAFRVSGGAFLNFNNSSLTLTPLNDQTIGGIHYSKEALGHVVGDISFNPLSPYIGVGVGNAGTKKGLALIMDLGVMYHGAPDVILGSDPILAPTSAQAQDVENKLSWAKWYPVLAIGLAYRL